jgi:hypothetical protein
MAIINASIYKVAALVPIDLQPGEQGELILLCH